MRTPTTSLWLVRDHFRDSAKASRSRAGSARLVTSTPGYRSGAPFGVTRIGHGRENGKYGLTDFMEVKSVVGEPA